MVRECEKLLLPHPVVSSCLGALSLAAFLHLQFIPDSKNMTGARTCWFLKSHSLPPVMYSASSPFCTRWDLLALALEDQGILSQETWLLQPRGASTPWMLESLCGLPLAACRRWLTPTCQSSAGTNCNTDVIILIKNPMLGPAVPFSDLR